MPPLSYLILVHAQSKWCATLNTPKKRNTGNVAYNTNEKLAEGTSIETGLIRSYYRNGRPFRENSNSDKEGDAKKLVRLREGDTARVFR